MIHIPLNDHTRQQLENTFKTTIDRRLCDRCQALLMADRGRRHHQIAADLRVTPQTLQRWLNAYRTGAATGSPSTGRRDALPASQRAWPLRLWLGSNKAPPAVAWTVLTGPLLNSPPICTR